MRSMFTAFLVNMHGWKSNFISENAGKPVFFKQVNMPVHIPGDENTIPGVRMVAYFFRNSAVRTSFKRIKSMRIFRLRIVEIGDKL